MSQPYYEDERVRLFHGDCREVTEWLEADVLVMDPPYGIGWTRGAFRGAEEAHAGIANDQDTSARDAALALWGPRPAVSFGSLYAPAPQSVRHVLIYEKPPNSGVIGSTTGYRRDIEAVYLCGTWPRMPASRGSVIRTGMTTARGPASAAGRTGHPHAKPLDVMSRLIEACPSGVIADPFAGSGSTLVAARNLGRKAIGVELDERYCETAALRLAQQPLDIFGDAS